MFKPREFPSLAVEARALRGTMVRSDVLLLGVTVTQSISGTQNLGPLCFWQCLDESSKNGESSYFDLFSLFLFKLQQVWVCGLGLGHQNFFFFNKSIKLFHWDPSLEVGNWLKVIGKVGWGDESWTSCFTSKNLFVLGWVGGFDLNMVGWVSLNWRMHPAETNLVSPLGTSGHFHQLHIFVLTLFRNKTTIFQHFQWVVKHPKIESLKSPDSANYSNNKKAENAKTIK